MEPREILSSFGGNSSPIGTEPGDLVDWSEDLVNVVLFAYIGFLGGQIHHQEIRTHAKAFLIDHEQMVSSKRN
jgi:hypothetical protein